MGTWDRRSLAKAMSLPGQQLSQSKERRHPAPSILLLFRAWGVILFPLLGDVFDISLHETVLLILEGQGAKCDIFDEELAKDN